MAVVTTGLNMSFLSCQNCDQSELCLSKEKASVCKQFQPKSFEMNLALQRSRLLIQILTPEMFEYVVWVASQRKLIERCQDAKGNALAFGDYVKFRFGLHQYTGTIEAYHISKSLLSIKIPIFKTPIYLHPSEIEKISIAEAKDLLFNELSIKERTSLQWNLECLSHEILTLKAKDSLTPKELKHLLLCEERFSLLEAQLKFDIVLKLL